VLGVEVLYNFSNGFLDDKQIQEKKPGFGKTTVVDVLYADDCVLFSNTVREMQAMVVCFDEVATIFGMELAIGKTKVVCNQRFLRAVSRNFENHRENKNACQRFLFSR
jgi:hypothetical protein